MCKWSIDEKQSYLLSCAKVRGISQGSCAEFKGGWKSFNERIRRNFLISLDEFCFLKFRAFQSQPSQFLES